MEKRHLLVQLAVTTLTDEGVEFGMTVPTEKQGFSGYKATA